MPDKQKRTAILIRCSAEEADLIRAAAKAERRTISAYILNAVMNRISAQKRFSQTLQTTEGKAELKR
jgi:uncharacterized protein (DUF1778 family)